MNRMKRCHLSVALPLLGLAQAHADTPATPTPVYDYAAIMPGIVFPARDIGTVGHGVTASAMYGRAIDAHWGYELGFDGAIFETGAHQSSDFYQQGLTGDVLFNFLEGRGTRLTPYALVGVGVAYDDFRPDERDGVGVLVSAGLGIVTQPLFNDRVSFRVEARYVRDSRDGGYAEPRVSAGFEIPLGRRPEIRYVMLESPALPPAMLEKVSLRRIERRVADDDADGVDDDRDRCPYTPTAVHVDRVGCVLPAQAIELRQVTFEPNDARLTPAARIALNRMAHAFLGQPSLRAEVACYSDAVGSAAADRSLTQARAESARAYLIARGAQPAQLVARGYAGTFPVRPERADDDGEQNRRIELHVLERIAL